MSKASRRLCIVCSALATLLVAPPAGHAQGRTATSSKSCSSSRRSSTTLFVRGVSCRTGSAVIKHALAHPGCTPTAEEQSLGRGCYGTSRHNGWTCRGLFPGEGYDLKCRRGRQYVHGGGGG